jgi:hypothetical protein
MATVVVELYRRTVDVTGAGTIANRPEETADAVTNIVTVAVETGVTTSDFTNALTISAPGYVVVAAIESAVHVHIGELASATIANSALVLAGTQRRFLQATAGQTVNVRELAA